MNGWGPKDIAINCSDPRRLVAVESPIAAGVSGCGSAQLSGCEEFAWIGTGFLLGASLLSDVLWLLLRMEMRVKPAFVDNEDSGGLDTVVSRLVGVIEVCVEFITIG